ANRGGACTKSRTILGNVAAQDELAALRIVPCRLFNCRDATISRRFQVGEGIRSCRPIRDATTSSAERGSVSFPVNKDKRHRVLRGEQVDLSARAAAVKERV